MKNKILSSIILGFGIGLSIFIVNNALAQNVNTADVKYPVEELGGCKDESDCRSYCDKSENLNSCLSFAKKNKLMSDEELAIAEKFAAVGNKGPGGCKNKTECENYCNDINHLDSCISFAEKSGICQPIN